MVDSVTSERAYPQRPSWNPAAEARAQVDAEQRALEVAAEAAIGKGRRVGLDRPGPFQPGLAPQQAAKPQPAAARHTTVPRVLVSLAPIIGLMGVTFAVMLEQRGLLDRISSVDVHGERSTSYQLDPSMTNTAIGIAFLVFALPIFAWGWWTVAATLNARAQSRQSGWPWTVPTSVLVAVAALVAASFVPSGPRSILYVASAVAYLWGAYGVLLGLCKSARAIKADPVVWSRLIWIPPLSVLSLVGAIKVADAVGSKAIAVFGSLLPFGLLLWAWLTICRAMADFDQACRTVEVSGGDSSGLPAFMTGNWVAR